MKRSAWVIVGVASLGLLGGCVERKYTVYTEPPGATVLRNGQPLTASPADDHFTYYGTYHFTLIKDGHETLQVDQEIKPPWYAYPPLDFFVENLWPFRVQDKREFVFALPPQQAVRTDVLMQQAEQARNRGRLVTPPPPPTGPVVAAPPPGTAPPAATALPPPVYTPVPAPR